LIFLIAFLFIWLPIGFFSKIVAKSKGSKSFSWYFGGIIFGSIDLIYMVRMPDKTYTKYFESNHLGYVVCSKKCRKTG
jgi:hypothetical protein